MTASILNYIISLQVLTAMLVVRLMDSGQHHPLGNKLMMYLIPMKGLGAVENNAQ